MKNDISCKHNSENNFKSISITEKEMITLHKKKLRNRGESVGDYKSFN